MFLFLTGCTRLCTFKKYYKRKLKFKNILYHESKLYMWIPILNYKK